MRKKNKDVVTILQKITPLLKLKNISLDNLSTLLSMNQTTLNEVLAQSFASDEFIEKLTKVLDVEPELLHNFKFTTVIINQIATNNGGNIHQNIPIMGKTIELYEQLIKHLNRELEEKNAIIEQLKKSND